MGLALATRYGETYIDEKSVAQDPLVRQPGPSFVNSRYLPRSFGCETRSSPSPHLDLRRYCSVRWSIPDAYNLGSSFLEPLLRSATHLLGAGRDRTSDPCMSVARRCSSAYILRISPFYIGNRRSIRGKAYMMSFHGTSHFCPPRSNDMAASSGLKASHGKMGSLVTGW